MSHVQRRRDENEKKISFLQEQKRCKKTKAGRDDKIERQKSKKKQLQQA
jgi:hypothetical protein